MTSSKHENDELERKKQERKWKKRDLDERNLALQREYADASEDLANLKQLLVAENVRKQKIADELETTRKMGRQPTNRQCSTPKSEAKTYRLSGKEMPRKNQDTDMIYLCDSSSSSNLGDHKMNIPDDDLPLPTFGAKKFAEPNQMSMDFNAHPMVTSPTHSSKQQSNFSQRMDSSGAETFFDSRVESSMCSDYGAPGEMHETSDYEEDEED